MISTLFIRLYFLNRCYTLFSPKVADHFTLFIHSPQQNNLFDRAHFIFSKPFTLPINCKIISLLMGNLSFWEACIMNNHVSHNNAPAPNSRQSWNVHIFTEVQNCPSGASRAIFRVHLWFNIILTWFGVQKPRSHFCSNFSRWIAVSCQPEILFNYEVLLFSR